MCARRGSCVSCNKMKQPLCQGEKLLIHIIAWPRSRRRTCSKLPSKKCEPGAEAGLGPTLAACSSSVPVRHLTHSWLCPSSAALGGAWQCTGRNQVPVNEKISLQIDVSKLCLNFDTISFLKSQLSLSTFSHSADIPAFSIILLPTKGQLHHSVCAASMAPRVRLRPLQSLLALLFLPSGRHLNTFFFAAMSLLF